jgi:hypothetical protein
VAFEVKLRAFKTCGRALTAVNPVNSAV